MKGLFGIILVLILAALANQVSGQQSNALQVGGGRQIVSQICSGNFDSQFEFYLEQMTHLHNDQKYKRLACMVDKYLQLSTDNYQNKLVTNLIQGFEYLIQNFDAVSSKQIIQQYFNGFFTQSDFPEPTTITLCFTNDDAQNLISFLSSVFKKMCEVSQGKFSEVLELRNAYLENLSNLVTGCLKYSKDLKNIKQFYEIPENNEQILSNYLSNYQASQLASCYISSQWEAQKYYEAGEAFAEMILNLDPAFSNKKI